MNTFATIEKCHRELDDLFAAHQRALVENRLLEANSLLREFGSALATHTADEESEIYPLMRAYAGDPPGASVPALIAEHRKLFALLDDLRTRMNELPGAFDVTEATIALVEHEATFKNLFEHHNHREERVVFPTLDTVLGDAERGRVLGRCTLELHGST